MAHQRSDFKETSDKHLLNYRVELSSEGNLGLSEKPLDNMEEHLKSIIDNTSEITDFDGMLLE